MDYTKICFVIMPYGIKRIGKTKISRWLPFTRPVNVDFDHIYEQIFAPAIRATALPEGGNLQPRRSDYDFFASSITQDMFEYLQYSRFAIADISGLNANVFYELATRHSLRESGTAVFRQLEAPIPFDINQTKAFPYEYEPEAKIIASCALITKVLTESLEQNRIDSPIQLALNKQQVHPEVETILREAENALRNKDFATAILKYHEALSFTKDNPMIHLRLGLLYKLRGEWGLALGEFDAAIQYSPSYAEAYREKGIAENKIYERDGKSMVSQTGEDALNKAVTLNSEDFDALASLGGLLKRQGRLEESVAIYRRATEVSQGHSYPLLNEIKIQMVIQNGPKIDEQRMNMIRNAQKSLEAQVTNIPPYNAPWSFFDLSDIYLFLGQREDFLNTLELGIEQCEASWQIETHRKGLEMIRDVGTKLEGIDDGIETMLEAENKLDGPPTS